ncbi:MAG: hypothetical protein V4734_08505 [Terriglobus sp.]
MRVVYEWTQSEWDEAVRLAAAKRRRRGSVSSITIGVILVPLIGGAITGLITLRHNTTLGVAGTILPLLLGLVALCIVLWFVMATWRMKRLRAAAPMPAGECEAVLQEGGWRFRPLTSGVEEMGVVETVTAATASEDETSLSATAAATLTPWSSMTGTREGRRVVVFLHEEGFAGVPTRCLSEDQVGHLQRMMARKLRPAATRR